MLKLNSLILFLLLINVVYSQTKPNSISKVNFFGIYEGHQDSYSGGSINGRDIIIPGSTYTFTISNGNKIKLHQEADNGLSVKYSGKYIILDKGDKIILSCQMIEDNYKYPSKPKFYITIKKAPLKIICLQDEKEMNPPSFELVKKEL